MNKKSLCNKIRLIACPVRYYIIKYPLQVDLVENSFSSVGRVVAYRAEGTWLYPSMEHRNITTYLSVWFPFKSCMSHNTMQGIISANLILMLFVSTFVNVLCCIELWGLVCYACLWVWFCPIDRYAQNKFMWLHLSATCRKKTHRWYNGNMCCKHRLYDNQVSWWVCILKIQAKDNLKYSTTCFSGHLY